MLLVVVALSLSLSLYRGERTPAIAVSASRGEIPPPELIYSDMNTIYIADKGFQDVFRKRFSLNGSTTAKDSELGDVIAWIMLNRPPSVHIEIRSSRKDRLPIVLPRPTVQVSVPESRPEADHRKCVEIFHIHCHFEPDTESDALSSLKTLKETLGEKQVLNDHVWHEVNGPHTKWSWELWIESTEALSVAAVTLMTLGKRYPDLNYMFHCDSDDEYTDHSLRMCFIGQRDDLDLLFFQETLSYMGPQAHIRKTNDDMVYSMGETWRREDLLKKTYDAMERSHGLDALPSFFLPHGSPPLPIEPCKSADFLNQLSKNLSCPKAIVFMSPHFLRDGFVVSTATNPSTLMDFDDDTDPDKLKILESLNYPCRGSPTVAREVANRIRAAGLKCDESPTRGMDHGVWTCLKLLFPKADVPVISLSVSRSLSAREHVLVGRALSPLSRKGVLLLGSGEVVHNVPLMGERQSTPQDFCIEFERWLEDASMKSLPGSRRDELLCNWRKLAPFADLAHPKSQPWPKHMTMMNRPFCSPGEHLMPWYFCYGAGGYNVRVKCLSKEYLGSLPMSAYEFKDCVGDDFAKL